jgi:hypothetical protein
LRESEASSDQFLQLAAAGMLVTLLAVLIAVILLEWLFNRKKA